MVPFQGLFQHGQQQPTSLQIAAGVSTASDAIAPAKAPNKKRPIRIADKNKKAAKKIALPASRRRTNPSTTKFQWTLEEREEQVGPKEDDEWDEL